MNKYSVNGGWVRHLGEIEIVVAVVVMVFVAFKMILHSQCFSSILIVLNSMVGKKKLFLE